MANFDYLKKLLPMMGKEVPAVTNAERNLLAQGERGLVNQADNAMMVMPDGQPISPEVLGMPSAQGGFRNNLPIEEADVLSPKLNGMVDSTPEMEKLKKYKAALAALGVGGGAALAINLNAPIDGSTPPPAPPAQVPAPEVKMPPMAPQMPQDDSFKAEESRIRALYAPSAHEEPAVKPAPIHDIDFGNGSSIASAKGLEDAQNASRGALLVNNVGRGASAAAAQMAGVRNQMDDTFAEQIKQAKDIPTEYMDRVKMEKEDPNSPMSKGYKAIVKSMGMNIKGTASAADIEKLIPQIANIYNQEQARIARAEQAKLDRESKREMAKEKALDRAVLLEANKGNKSEQLKNKFIESAQKRMSAEFEKLQKMENAFDSLELAKKDKVGASDVTMLYNFIKAQDPESVVREGEIALGQRGMSLGGRIRTMTLGQLTGEMLDPKFRSDIVKIARRLKDQGHTSYNQSVQTIRDTAQQRYGMTDDELTLIDPVLNRQKKKEAAQQTAPSAPAASAAPVGASGLTPEQRQKRIQELQAKKGQ